MQVAKCVKYVLHMLRADTHVYQMGIMCIYLTRVKLVPKHMFNICV